MQRRQRPPKIHRKLSFIKTRRAFDPFENQISRHLAVSNHLWHAERVRITQQRQEVANRLDIIAKLDQERYFRVKVLDEISRCVPENMWLTKLDEQAGHSFAVEGVTFSNILVARFMSELEAAPHWQKVELGVAQQGKIDSYEVVQFSLVSGAQP